MMKNTGGRITRWTVPFLYVETYPSGPMIILFCVDIRIESSNIPNQNQW